MTTSHELVVVTGASSGMGRATAVALARRGFHVLAGVRSAEAGDDIREPGLEPVLLDVTRPEDVAALAGRVARDPEQRPLRALVNCAGMAANGPVEVLPLSTWRAMFEVNLFGQIALIQALLPALRRSGGRIVNVSSTGGRIAMAAFGAYSATKFALEAVSDALRREVHDQGVEVTVIEPGAVRTGMIDSGTRAAHALTATMSDDQRIRYDRLMTTFHATVREFERTGMSADAAGAEIADVVTAPRARSRRTIGRDAALFTRLARLLPDGVLDWALASSGRRAVVRSARAE